MITIKTDDVKCHKDQENTSRIEVGETFYGEIDGVNKLLLKGFDILINLQNPTETWSRCLDLTIKNIEYVDIDIITKPRK